MVRLELRKVRGHETCPTDEAEQREPMVLVTAELLLTSVQVHLSSAQAKVNFS